MRYFLDFDRTLFDTDAFIPFLFEHKEMQPTGEEIFEESILSLVGKKDIVFSPNELTPFLFADSAETLRSFGNEATIITFGNEGFQKAKVESALAGIPRISTLYTDGVEKGEFLSNNKHLWSGEAIFVDDSVLQLESVQKYCPNIRLFEIRRDGKEGDGRFQVIHSLSELP